MVTWRTAVAAGVALAVAGGVAGCPQEAEPVENTAALCSDSVDNDGDGAIDCADIDCGRFCGGDGDADSDADSDGDAGEDGDVDGGGDGDVDGDADVDTDDDDGDGDAGSDADDPVGPVACRDDGDCPPAMRCYDVRLDGLLLCAPRGASCNSADGCEPGVTCGPVARSPIVGDFCLVSAGACGASSSCPEGFRCESGSCTDRRFACAGSADCAWWDRCTALRAGPRVCAPGGLEHCTADEQCTMELCVDIDGNGDRECQEPIGSTCTTNADCDGAVCGEQDGERGVECGAVGPCLTSDDCPGTMECVDVNADGDRECQTSGGACAVDADCPERQLCRPGAGSAPTSCLGAA